MSTEIGVALIIGITIGTTSLIWKSESFTYSQKVFLSICFLFPPAQWVLAILLYLFNAFKTSTSNTSNSQNIVGKPKISINEQKQSLQILKDKGVLNETEYQEKIDIIDEQIIIEKIHKSSEYQNLKNVYESELLTKEQFDEKTNKLIADYKEYYSIFGENNYPEFTWELFQNMKINKKINPYDYKNSDFLGKWKFKNGQLFLYNENGLNKLKVTWTNGINRYGDWDLSNQQINLRLSKSFGHDKAIIQIDELGTHIFVYYIDNKKYTCIKDSSENKNVW